MFQFAFPTALFQLRVRRPAFRPLLQLPNRRATPEVTPAFSPVDLSVSRAEPVNPLLPGELRFAYPRTP